MTVSNTECEPKNKDRLEAEVRQGTGLFDGSYLNARLLAAGPGDRATSATTLEAIHFCDGLVQS